MSGRTQKTVLVTDDDPMLREIAVKVIESRGYRVLEASSGEEAIETVSRGVPVDLHVLDVLMEPIDGIETIARLKDLGFGDVPVVLLTAQRSDQDLMEGYRAGAGYYLTKPFAPAALINIVDYLIGDLSADQREKLALRL